ncbi:MAG TPA: fasciclin domain-containing protein [Flavobacteriaceae bacterium]|nr:fasciclin domain-containing protein [Flavobacteriaceae bacterium]
MHNMLNKSNIIFLAILFLTITACEKDDNNAYIYGTNSVVNHLERDANYSLFLEAIQEAGMYAQLDGNAGSYTVLAPDNEAMENYLSENEFSEINEIPDGELLRLVDYHIIEELTPAENFITGYSPTLAEVPVNDSVSANLSLYVKNMIDEVEFNGTTQIVVNDIIVDNGIVHKINHTLSPPTLKTFMDADGNLNAFYEKITGANVTTDFEDLLANPDQQTTILVPNEFAVEDFFNGDGAGMTDQELNNVYRYHLLDTVKLVQNIRSGYLSTKASEEYSGDNHPLNLYINTQAGLLLNTETIIVISDLMTINGNIQVIDRVMELPTVRTFVKADVDYRDFYNSLSDSLQLPQQYMELLGEAVEEGNGPFTVFAPNESAFQDLVEEIFGEEPGVLEDIDQDQMTDILNLHVVKNQALRSEDFSNQNLNTLGGATIQLDADNNQLIDPLGNPSKILIRDFQAANGVLHEIDRVLQPY